jgi:hypothetical protein
MESLMLTPEVKPEIVFIFELLREVATGKLRIPKFQRPYVWGREQMTDLLDSINRQYPIGSLLVWETDATVSSLQWIGPVEVKETIGGLASHVLDGHQRLSTLTGVLMAPSERLHTREDDIDPNRWLIWFNAKQGSFEHPKASSAQPEPWHFPMWKLLDTVSFLAESQRMLEEGGSEGAGYVQQLQKLLQRFQSYKIPVIRIKNTGLNQAVEIFARLNSKGKPMTADQMVSALMYREAPSGEPIFNLSDHIDDILVDLEVHDFGGIDRVTVLRALLATLGEDIYRTDWTRLTDSKRSDLQERLPTVVGETRVSLMQAAEFLRGLGVHNHRLLPYAMQLVVFSAFFGACPDPNPEQVRFLERWFWVSSFSGWFASGNPSRVGALLREFRERVANNPSPGVLENMRMDEPAQAFPTSFDMRSARARTLLLVQLALKPRDEVGNQIKAPWQRVGEHGPIAIGYIAATAQDKTLASSPANRLLKLDIADRSQGKNWLVRLGDEGDETVRLILESHAIPPNSLHLLKENDADQFLQIRREYLIQLERRFMGEKGVVPPLGRETQPAPYDTSDPEQPEVRPEMLLSRE